MSTPTPDYEALAEQFWNQALIAEPYPVGPVEATAHSLELLHRYLERNSLLPFIDDELHYDSSWMDGDMGGVEIETPEEAGRELQALMLWFARTLIAPHRERMSGRDNEADYRSRHQAELVAVGMGQSWAQKLALQLECDLDDTPLVRVGVSYETVTPESAANGEAAERGMHTDEPQVFETHELEQVLEVAEPSESPLTNTEHCWYTVYDHDGDPATGRRTHYSYHPADSQSGEVMAYLWRRCLARTNLRERD